MLSAYLCQHGVSVLVAMRFGAFYAHVLLYGLHAVRCVLPACMLLAMRDVRSHGVHYCLCLLTYRPTSVVVHKCECM